MTTPVAARLALFALVACCALAWPVPLAQAQATWEKIIDDGDPGYSETGKAWKNWSIGSAYNGDYRYLSHHDMGLPRVGTATWQTTVPHTGMYEIHAHIRQTVNRTTDADYKFTDGNGKAHHVVLNQKALPTGWHSLGTYYWKAGQVSKITLDGTDDNQSDEADAMRWRYKGSGGPPPPPPPVDKCTQQAPGTYTLKRHATQASASGDWAGAAKTTGAPDGQLASSPNVDAGEVLTASTFKFCTPPGSFQITGVKIGVMAKMQYDSGQYKLIMYLQGAGQRFTFSQTSLAWVYGDVTKAKANWQIADLNNLQLKVGLNSHPGGKRDSDAWIDAFVVEVTYQVSQPPPQCPAGQTMCSGGCVDLQASAQHCGKCGQSCASGERCQSGTCAFQCPKGTTLCGARLCVDTAQSADHCGGCNAACAAPKVCSQGTCSQTCAAPTTLCNKQCVDTSTDPNHCGGCDKACKESEGCQASACKKSCAGAEILCSSDCIDSQTDTSHCGGCNKPCAPGESCQHGACTKQVICRDQQLRCGDECVDHQNDNRHCGVCDNPCQSWQNCQAGQCIGEPDPFPPAPEPTPTDAGHAPPPITLRPRRGCGCHTLFNTPHLPLLALWLAMLGLIIRRSR